MPHSEHKPYAEMVEMLRSALTQAEHDVSLHPNDPDTVRLRDSLQRLVVDMQPTEQFRGEGP